MEPKHNRGRSKQDYRTPPEFLRALKARLGVVGFYRDLAASDDSVAPRFFSKEDDALTKEWVAPEGEWLFCNPPYSNIGPWVMKASECSSNVAMLIPASVGSNWWKDSVDGVANVLFLNGRLTFVGATAPYPKDCAILLFTHKRGSAGYSVWSWRE